MTSTDTDTKTATGTTSIVFDSAREWAAENYIQVIEVTLLAIVTFSLGLWVGIEAAWRLAYVAEYPYMAALGPPVDPAAAEWVDPLRRAARAALWVGVGGGLAALALGPWYD